MLSWVLILLAILVMVAPPTFAANLLALHPFPAYSHVTPFLPIYEELARRGHNFTLISTHLIKSDHPGLTQLPVNMTIQDMTEGMEREFGKGNTVILAESPWQLAFQLAGIALLCDALTPTLMERIKPLLPAPGTKFDLVFFEPFFCMEPLAASSIFYEAPIVATLPLPLIPPAAAFTGNPQAVSYVPNVRTSFTAEMTFLERVCNTLAVGVELIFNFLYHLPKQDKLMRKVFDQPNIPYVGDLLKNISLVLSESYFSLSYPRPLLRNVVEVGGVSIQAAEPLPADIETFMNNGQHGVIYFSWGSHFQAANVEKIIESLMKIFSKRKERVLFKWSENIPNAPPNVRVQKWFPQRSILAHNKTVLFISHGGLNSVYEAVYYGVPVLGTPLFADQPYNIRLVEYLGMAIKMDPQSLSDEIAFSSALERILNEPSFRENAVKEKLKLRERPISAVEEAVYWIEYILRHGHAHLQQASRDLPWYSLYLLDVSLFLLALLLLCTFVIYSSIAFCLGLCKRMLSTKPLSQKHKKNQ